MKARDAVVFNLTHDHPFLNKQLLF